MTGSRPRTRFVPTLTEVVLPSGAGPALAATPAQTVAPASSSATRSMLEAAVDDLMLWPKNSSVQWKKPCANNCVVPCVKQQAWAISADADRHNYRLIPLLHFKISVELAPMPK